VWLHRIREASQCELPQRFDVPCRVWLCESPALAVVSGMFLDRGAGAAVCERRDDGEVNAVRLTALQQPISLNQFVQLRASIKRGARIQLTGRHVAVRKQPRPARARQTVSLHPILSPRRPLSSLCLHCCTTHNTSPIPCPPTHSRRPLCSVARPARRRARRTATNGACGLSCCCIPDRDFRPSPPPLHTTP